MDGSIDNVITCKIFSLNGAEFCIEVDKEQTFSDLKIKILQNVEIFKSPGEFNLILNGRIVRNENDKISSHVDKESNAVTLFINSSKVHSGCCPNYCPQK